MAQSKKLRGLPQPLPSEGKIFGVTIGEVIERGFDKAIRTQREQCAQAAEAFLEENLDSCQSRTAAAIAKQIRQQ